MYSKGTNELCDVRQQVVTVSLPSWVKNNLLWIDSFYKSELNFLNEDDEKEVHFHLYMK